MSLRNEIPVIWDHRRCLHGLSLQVGDVHHWDHPVGGHGLICASWWDEGPHGPQCGWSHSDDLQPHPFAVKCHEKRVCLDPSVTGTGRNP